MTKKAFVFAWVISAVLSSGWLCANVASLINQKIIHMATDMRMLRTAMETYVIDNNAFPFSTAQTGQPGIAPGVPTFGSVTVDFGNGNSGAYSLTTPIAYLSKMPTDYFAEKPKRTFAYATTGTQYLVWSAGPDNRFDIKLEDFESNAEKQSAEFHAQYSYDPSNGLPSTGDLWFSRSDSAQVLSDMGSKPKRQTSARLGPLAFMHEMATVAKPVTPKTQLDGARAGMRMIATGLEIYRLDNNAYPVFTTDTEKQMGLKKLPGGVPTFQRSIVSKPGLVKSESGQLRIRKEKMLASLTTPIAYLTKMPMDPYTDGKSSFAYINRGDQSWLLWSAGPDGKYDVVLDDFTKATVWPSPEFMAQYAYDVSNGTMSSGDVLRLKQ